jgi:hypothetical protein
MDDRITDPRDAVIPGTRDALAHARLLSGNPALARGQPVLAEADPLRVLPREMRAAGGACAAASDHTSPERQVFVLPGVRRGMLVREEV